MEVNVLNNVNFVKMKKIIKQIIKLLLLAPILPFFIVSWTFNKIAIGTEWICYQWFRFVSKINI
jgi:hypothetical protein